MNKNSIKNKIKFLFIISIFFLNLNFIYANICENKIPTNINMNDKIELCNNTYYINSKINLKRSVTFNCNGGTLINNGSKIGMDIPGEYKIEITNCKFINFSKAIYSYNYNYRDWAGSYKTAQSSYLDINNNIFENNNISIYFGSGYMDKIYNNTFKNDKEYSINIAHKSPIVIYNNIFKGNPNKNKSIFFESFKSISFCKNNISNIYFGNTSGPECNCYYPESDLIVDLSINFCKGNYVLNKPIRVLENVNLNCMNSSFLGNKNITAINIYGAKNTIIQNCNFNNFNIGINYAGISNDKNLPLRSYNNKVFNNSFENINIALYFVYQSFFHGNSLAEEIHNNNFKNISKFIFKNFNQIINASFNNWNFNNITKIKEKLDVPDSILLNPIIKNKINITNEKNDLFIDKNSIEINNSRLHFNLFKKINSQIELFNLNIFLFQNNSILENTSISINSSFNISKNISINFSRTLKQNDKIKIIIDFENTIDEIDENNNIIDYIIKSNKKVFVESISYENFINLEFEKYLKYKLVEFEFTNNLDEANISIQIIKNKDTSNFLKNKLENIIDKSFFLSYFKEKPYQGKIITSNNNNIQNIILIGNRIEGNIATLKEFISNKEKYLNFNNSVEINRNNIDAIKIYDNLHKSSNKKYFMKNNDNFITILRNVLYDNLYEIEEIFIPIETTSNKTINYKLQYLKPQFSNNYLDFINQNSYPIILGGGLWSDINTWKKLGKELSSQGFNSYLIELTGGNSSECDSCYNYNYSFLTDIVYPAYISKVQELSASNKIKYIGHSNGARVALDSLSRRAVNQEDFDTLIAVGVPGAFDGKIAAKDIVISLNQTIENNFKNKTHISINEVLTLGYLHFNSNQIGKISNNLWRTYKFWMTNKNDSQPGKNISLNKFILIAGNLFNLGNDGIVSIEDEKEIFNNINSSDKNYFEGNYFHVGMTENEEILKYIKDKINNKNEK